MFKITFLEKHFRETILASAFVAGFCMMVTELVASRIIAPIIGASLYTWTSIIGVVMVGMVIGNYFGGRLIDKYPFKKTIAIFYYFASISVLLIPIISHYLGKIVFLPIPLSLLTIMTAGSLFLLPSFAIGAIYPCIFKYSITRLSDLGFKSGKVSALWSIGSIIGTFITGFALIEYVGSIQTLIYIAIILFLNGLFINLSEQINFKIGILFIIIICYLVFTISSNSKINMGVLYEKESAYYKIRISNKQDLKYGDIRIMFLDFDSHSIESLEDKNLGLYTNMPPIFEAMVPNMQNILVIGGGSQSISKEFQKKYPSSSLKTIEIDPAVSKAAERFFPSKISPIQTIISDGRLYLEKNSDKYDLIFSDAYNSFISVPIHMSTKEFNDLAKSRLTDNGAYAVNFISALEGENSMFFQGMLRTFIQTFPNYYVFAYGNNDIQAQNIVLVGINSNNIKDTEKIITKVSLIEEKGDYFSKKIIRNPQQFLKDPSIGVLTDNFSPVEKLMLPLIKNYFPLHARYYQDML